MKNSKINLTLQAHASYSYVPRTEQNANSAEVTVAFAVDFTTAGERLTRRVAGPNRYVAIPYGGDVEKAAVSLANFLASKNASSLNVAGNGIYTLAEHGITQAQCNDWVYAVLKRVVQKHDITHIRSGGQTGIDQAGLVAAIALGVSAMGLYPASFRHRNREGREVTATAAAIQAELEEQASCLSQGPRRRYHPDGTLPQEGEVLVFGSNLAGRHGLGSADVARRKFGAQYGVGPGRQGQSYGIPTKDGRPLPGNPKPTLTDPKQTLSLLIIKGFIDEFIAYAKAHPDEQFWVVRLGCKLATHKDADIAPMFHGAPDNCSFPDVWQPWLEVPAAPKVILAEPVNIWSGSKGLGGALTNMSERAREKGCIKHSYPVVVNGVTYADSEAAYQALKVRGEDDYNDGLMIDLIALKFKQNPILFERVTQKGGEAWLETCSHFTQAKSPSFQSWEGQGTQSRFIRNLIWGYRKAKSGVGPKTRVVHVKDAPYDVYIGRQVGAEYAQSEWHNPAHVTASCSREEAVKTFHERIQNSPVLMAKVQALKGKTIGCWCKGSENIHLLCHGDVLAALAEGHEWAAPQEVQGSLF